jgi:hypothetical protein
MKIGLLNHKLIFDVVLMITMPVELLIHICTFMLGGKIMTFIEHYNFPEIIHLFTKPKFAHMLSLQDITTHVLLKSIGFHENCAVMKAHDMSKYAIFLGFKFDCHYCSVVSVRKCPCCAGRRSPSWFAVFCIEQTNMYINTIINVQGVQQRLNLKSQVKTLDRTDPVGDLMVQVIIKAPCFIKTVMFRAPTFN